VAEGNERLPPITRARLAKIGQVTREEKKKELSEKDQIPRLRNVTEDSSNQES